MMWRLQMYKHTQPKLNFTGSDWFNKVCAVCSRLGVLKSSSCSSLVRQRSSSGAQRFNSSSVSHTDRHSLLGFNFQNINGTTEVWPRQRNRAERGNIFQKPCPSFHHLCLQVCDGHLHVRCGSSGESVEGFRSFFILLLNQMRYSLSLSLCRPLAHFKHWALHKSVYSNDMRFAGI